MMFSACIFYSVFCLPATYLHHALLSSMSWTFILKVCVQPRVYVRVQEGVTGSVSGSSAAAAACRRSREALTVWAKGKYVHDEA